MEALEDRRMLSAIVWMNRYTFDGTDDNHFDEAFNIPLPFGAIDTTKRDEAIAVVDAVILKWERVINSFNYVSPSTAFQVNISMTAAAQGIGRRRAYCQHATKLDRLHRRQAFECRNYDRLANGSRRTSRCQRWLVSRSHTE